MTEKSAMNFRVENLEEDMDEVKGDVKEILTKDVSKQLVPLLK